MSDNIKSKVLSKIDTSPFFALQLDESTDISNLSQLLVYVRYVADERVNEEFLFCQPLETTSKAVDVFQMLIDFFDETELSWSKLVGVSYCAFIPHSSSLAVKREHALSYFRTKRRSQVVLSCQTKTRSFVGIWWRQIFYILSLPC